MKEQWNNNGICAKQIESMEKGTSRPIFIEMHRCNEKHDRSTCCTFVHNTLRAMVTLMLILVLSWCAFSLWKFCLRPVRHADKEIVIYSEIGDTEKNLGHAISPSESDIYPNVMSRSTPTTFDNGYVTTEPTVKYMQLQTRKPNSDKVESDLGQIILDKLHFNIELVNRRLQQEMKNLGTTEKLPMNQEADVTDGHFDSTTLTQIPELWYQNSEDASVSTDNGNKEYYDESTTKGKINNESSNSTEESTENEYGLAEYSMDTIEKMDEPKIYEFVNTLFKDMNIFA